MARNGVRWEYVSEAEFNELAEQLIFARTRDTPGLYAKVIDGRGGDEGIDIGIYVRKTDQLVEILQLKYFPGGFSSTWKARRTQIKKSFTRAMELRPPKWTLVVPTNGTIPERKFVTLLKGAYKVQMGFLGKVELDALLVQYPAVEAWAMRNPVVDALALIGRESAVLTRPNDVLEEIERLKARVDARTDYWGINWGVRDGESYQEIYPKRGDAAEMEPLSINMTLTFSAEHADLKSRFEDTINYGALEPLILTAEVVQAFDTQGPEWFQSESSGGEVHLIPVDKNQEPKPVRVRAVNEQDETLATLTGKLTRITKGQLGGLLEMHFAGGLRLVWKVDENPGSGGNIAFSFGAVGNSATLIRRNIKFVEGASQAAKLVLTIDGVDGSVLLPTSLSWPGMGVVHDELIDDLAFLERNLDVSFEYPAEVPSVSDRLWIRVARRFLEGRVTVAPHIGSITAVLSGKDDPDFRRLITEGGAIQLTNDAWVTEVLGQRLELGDVALYHHSVTVPDSGRLIEGFEQGTAEDMPLEMKPSDDTGFRIYSPSRMHADAHVVAEPWNISGIGEHKMLDKLLSLQSGGDATESSEAPSSSG